MSSHTPDPNLRRKVINMTLAVFAGQVGCLTFVIVLAALIGGLALDGAFNTKPWITVILLVISAPISLFLMFKLVTKATAKIKAVAPDQKSKEKEEALGGKDS